MNAAIYIAAALAALCAVLLVIVIMKLGRLSAGDGQIKELESKISSLEGQLRDEFERSRRESAGNQKDMRSELTESLDKMNERLALMTEANFKHQQQLTDMFSKSLDTIRRNNIEQNDRQSRIIAESIEKMQQSNEKSSTKCERPSMKSSPRLSRPASTARLRPSPSSLKTSISRSAR